MSTATMPAASAVILPFSPALVARRKPRRPKQAGGGLSGDMPLSEFFARWFVPRYCRSKRRPLKAATEAEFSTAVSRWIEILGDTGMENISAEMCREFVEGDCAMKGRAASLAARTVKKHCVALSTIFAQAGPRSRKHPDAASDEGLFGTDRFGRPRDVPWFPPLQLPKPAVKEVATLEEIRLWLAVCDGARAPRLPHITPGQWWRALVLFLYNSGCRIGETLRAERSMIVHGAGGAVWLDLPAAIAKQGKAREVLLNSQALTAIESLGTTGLLFPWPHSLKHLHTIRRELQAAAGIAAERRLGFHSLRRSTGTELYTIDPDAATEQLGHEDGRTTTQSYVAAERISRGRRKKLQPALDALPQPQAASQQLFLF